MLETLATGKRSSLFTLSSLTKREKSFTTLTDEEVKPVANDYTNLYWQPDTYSVYENEYEIVEDNSMKLAQPNPAPSDGMVSIL
jgi:hypothetical protein